MTQTFTNWTDYDNWLVLNYEQYAVISLNEENSIITAEYIKKEDWEKQQREAETAQTQASAATEPSA